MNDDIEQRLDRLTLRGVRPELRTQVLGAVAEELESRVGQANRSPTVSGDDNEHTAACVPLLGTSSAGRKRSERHCLFQAVAHVNEECAPAADTDSPWLRRAAMAVAASLLLGVGLNVWASKSSECHLAQLFGPPPISKQAMEIAKAVEQITDAQTGQWVYRRLAPPRHSGDGAAAYAKYCDTIKRLIDELQTASKDSYHETPQKDSEMDRGHTVCPRGHRFDCQRRVRLDHRCTA
jgi:hypothetical protein